MRVWDLPPERLCRNHLLGEHNEIHAIFSIITTNKMGYLRHPEVKRWEGKLNALYKRHEIVVNEMLIRGYNHKSPLNITLATGKGIQDQFVNSIKEQLEILKEKKCECRI